MTDSPSDIPSSTRWELSREAWERLLEKLGPNPESASLTYEALRARLIDLFAWEGEPDPAHLADETLNRLARKIMEGEPIRDLNRYAVGIARMVMFEAARSRQKQTLAMREIRLRGPNDSQEPLDMGAMNRCLQSIPQENRDLIQRYYTGDRAKLAESLGISLNALRNRALRIRQRLFDSLRQERDNPAKSGHRE